MMFFKNNVSLNNFIIVTIIEVEKIICVTFLFFFGFRPLLNLYFKKISKNQRTIRM